MQLCFGTTRTLGPSDPRTLGPPDHRALLPRHSKLPPF
ncbi:hypothetical protein APTSU1_000722500 [Apodemus speciosus]|uniref:Uncharacterized protein n=1 Tax=Apodemus speciosus TaxID=105296 RepID=A0ABQ0EY67_APOSI